MNEIIKYDNYMNSLKFTGFTTTDFNFLMALCSRVRDKGTNKIVFSFSELRTITDYKKSNSIKQFVSDLERMNEKLMRVVCKLRTETKIIMFVLFPTFEIDTEKQELTVAVNEDFKFILNELIKNFTRFDLNEFVKLGSKYAKTLYRLLKQFKSTGRLEAGLDEFRRRMDIPASYTNRDVMSKVINPVVKELQGCFQDLQCTVKYEHKRGKPVSGYIFTFTPEQPPKPEPRELPVKEAKPSGLQEKLTQEEKDKLVKEFGQELTEKYIERTKEYKCCNYATIREWILEDMGKKQNTKTRYKAENQFNNFPQREVTQEEMDNLEYMLLNKN